MISTTRRIFDGRPALRQAAAAASMAAAAALSGCGPTIASLPGIGEPPYAQNRPAVRPETPNVYVPAIERDEKPMSAAERAKLEAELVRARERSAAQKRDEINQPSR